MIKVQTAPFSLRFAAGPLALFLLEDGGLALHPAANKRAARLTALAKKEHAAGKPGEIVKVALGPQTVLLAGVGKKKDLTTEKLREASGRLAKAAEKYPALAVALPDDGTVAAADAALALTEGLKLGTYRFTRHRSTPKGEGPALSKASILVSAAAKKDAERAVRKGAIRAEAVAWVRDWVNEGPSDKKPETLAAEAQALAGGPISVQVFGKAELAERGMNAILGVARGSLVEPRFVHLTYKPEGDAKKKIALVGKGITFDSGGLSLKPAQSMETMKLDMAGGAVVLAVFRALAKQRPPVEVHGFVPFTYNLPGGDALKPGDILKAYNGKTIEVLNTDAEGRLVLSDALAYATELGFDAIIDLATLTGAALVALGSSITATMVNDRELWDALRAASERTGEKLWELPLPPEYKEGLKSKVADLQNISSVRGEAGTIIGGLFLQEFVDGKPWAHLDIAGTAWADRPGPYTSHGGTGALVRTMLEYLEGLY